MSSIYYPTGISRHEIVSLVDPRKLKKKRVQKKLLKFFRKNPQVGRGMRPVMRRRQPVRNFFRRVGASFRSVGRRRRMRRAGRPSRRGRGLVGTAIRRARPMPATMIRRGFKGPMIRRMGRGTTLPRGRGTTLPGMSGRGFFSSALKFAKKHKGTIMKGVNAAAKYGAKELEKRGHTKYASGLRTAHKYGSKYLDKALSGSGVTTKRRSMLRRRFQLGGLSQGNHFPRRALLTNTAMRRRF